MHLNVGTKNKNNKSIQSQDKKTDEHHFLCVDAQIEEALNHQHFLIFYLFIQFCTNNILISNFASASGVLFNRRSSK